MQVLVFLMDVFGSRTIMMSHPVKQGFVLVLMKTRFSVFCVCVCFFFIPIVGFCVNIPKDLIVLVIILLLRPFTGWMMTSVLAGLQPHMKISVHSSLCIHIQNVRSKVMVVYP